MTWSRHCSAVKTLCGGGSRRAEAIIQITCRMTQRDEQLWHSLVDDEDPKHGEA